MKPNDSHKDEEVSGQNRSKSFAHHVYASTLRVAGAHRFSALRLRPARGLREWRGVRGCGSGLRKEVSGLFGLTWVEKCEVLDHDQ